MTPRDPLARPDKDSPNVLTVGAWVMRDGVLAWEPADATPEDSDNSKDTP